VSWRGESAHRGNADRAKTFRNGKFSSSGSDALERTLRQEVDLLKPSPAHTARFQPYGLMKSRCFQASKDTLSCLTCHKPHSNVSSNKETYEKACLSCHDTSGSTSKTQGQAAVKACPVNPKSGCISCHMPKRGVLPTSDVDTMMADHHIRIFPSKPQNRGRTSVPSSLGQTHLNSIEVKIPLGERLLSARFSESLWLLSQSEGEIHGKPSK